MSLTPRTCLVAQSTPAQSPGGTHHQLRHHQFPNAPPTHPQTTRMGVRICRPTTHTTTVIPVLLHQTLHWASHRRDHRQHPGIQAPHQIRQNKENMDHQLCQRVRLPIPGHQTHQRHRHVLLHPQSTGPTTQTCHIWAHLLQHMPTKRGGIPHQNDRGGAIASTSLATKAHPGPTSSQPNSCSIQQTALPAQPSMEST
jgi:hypothetical protein